MRLLFAFPDYYPRGGAEDLVAVLEGETDETDVVDAVREWITENFRQWDHDNLHVYDTTAREITHAWCYERTDRTDWSWLGEREPGLPAQLHDVYGDVVGGPKFPVEHAWFVRVED